MVLFVCQPIVLLQYYLISYLCMQEEYICIYLFINFLIYHMIHNVVYPSTCTYVISCLGTSLKHVCLFVSLLDCNVTVTIQNSIPAALLCWIVTSFHRYFNIISNRLRQI